MTRTKGRVGWAPGARWAHNGKLVKVSFRSSAHALRNHQDMRTKSVPGSRPGVPALPPRKEVVKKSGPTTRSSQALRNHLAQCIDDSREDRLEAVRRRHAEELKDLDNLQDKYGMYINHDALMIYSAFSDCIRDLYQSRHLIELEEMNMNFIWMQDLVTSIE